MIRCNIKLILSFGSALISIALSILGLSPFSHSSSYPAGVVFGLIAFLIILGPPFMAILSVILLLGVEGGPKWVKILCAVVVIVAIIISLYWFGTFMTAFSGVGR